MRTLIFLFLVICLGTLSQAQENPTAKRVQVIVMPMAQAKPMAERLPMSSQTAARFFKVKNARIKRALAFKPISRRTLVA
ncbi:hypothetical protein Q2T41_15585 [Maribacter confluentis]|uniref:Helix-turn-helix domain-containing protein n=1 Tax=Maribacter confluentis TaxID=1656093 RepID=A0ABT8RT54_9FLAO|nr:hypothetical protein [Maribacter confluentis]MDO1514083.1 hypothetical protein [Maribacter confluentis]